jgi:hypothetical protein
VAFARKTGEFGQFALLDSGQVNSRSSWDVSQTIPVLRHLVLIDLHLLALWCPGDSEDGSSNPLESIVESGTPILSVPPGAYWIRVRNSLTPRENYLPLGTQKRPWLEMTWASPSSLGYFDAEVKNPADLYRQRNTRNQTALETLCQTVLGDPLRYWPQEDSGSKPLSEMSNDEVISMLRAAAIQVMITRPTTRQHWHESGVPRIRVGPEARAMARLIQSRFPGLPPGHVPPFTHLKCPKVGTSVPPVEMEPTFRTLWQMMVFGDSLI